MDNEEDFIDVSCWSSRTISKLDCNALVLTCERMETLVPNFDCILFAKSLKISGFITEEIYENILRNTNKGLKNNPIMIVMRYGVPSSLEDVYSMLNFGGITVVPTVIRAEVERPLTKVAMENVTFNLTYYKSLKESMDNNWFKKVTDYLHSSVDEMKTKLCNSQTNNQNRQRYLDKINVLTVLKMQHGLNTDSSRQILNKMVADVPHDLDKTSTELVFYGEMAITEALDDNFDDARDYAEHAKRISFSYQPFFASISALLNITYVYRILYVKTRDESMLKRLVNEGYRAIDTLESMGEGIRALWKVLLFQFILLSLLGIDLDLGVDVTRRLDQRYIKMAEDLIKAISDVKEVLTERRKMILNLAKARFNEESDIIVALAYAEDAQSLANEYTFREVEAHNIRSYVRHLKQTQLQKKEKKSKYWLWLGFTILVSVFLQLYLH